MARSRSPSASSTRLKAHNASLPDETRVGFYGLDVYSLWDSMDVVTRYLEKVDPQAAARARGAYGCVDPYEEDVQDYAMVGMVNVGSLARERWGGDERVNG